MKAYELVFGALSLLSFILSFSIEDNLLKISFIFAGFLILIVFYLGTTIKVTKDLAETSSYEVNKFKEHLNIYEKLVHHEIRLKHLEGSKK